MILDVSFGKSRSDKNWKAEYLEWPELVDKLKEVRRTKETMAEYEKMDSFSKGRIKDGPGFVGGLVKTGRRKKENIDSRSLITLDADFADDNFLFDVDFALGGTAYFAYSTHSHRPDRQKYRLIIPLDRSVGVDEYAAISRKVADTIGLKYFDKTTFQPHRLMYLPSCSTDAEPVGIEGQGEALDPDEWLAKYSDWTDISQWPRHDSADKVKTAVEKAEDPHSKRGVIGLFCRTFSIEAAIETFLSEQYERGSMPNRYTYTNGHSANGLEIYPDQDLAYSHQDSDPISDGRTYNAFDIVRVHKFGHLDADWAEDTKTPPPSVAAMETWASRLPKVKKQSAVEREADFAEFADEMDEDDPNWEEQLETHHKTGEVLPTAKNIERILSFGEMYKAIAYDAFGNAEVVLRDLPWRKKDEHVEYEPWQGADDARMRHWLGTKYKIGNKGGTMDAFSEVVRRNSFHPVKEFIESVAWDGIPRAERLFIDFLGADDCHYVRQATRKALLAAVTRIYRPGTKFDEMLVLISDQGAGKSTLLAKLGGKWFSDSLRNFDSKEAGEHLQKSWIVELSELSALKTAELEDVKAFLSKTEDRYRVAYDRAVSSFPRKCVFFGTTNTREFLRDKTGNRRFWPVECYPENAKYSHWENLTEAGVRQIWAEVYTWFVAGESLLLDKNACDEAKTRQKQHLEDEAWEGIISDWLESDEEDFDGTKRKRDRVCATQIAVECLFIPKGQVARKDILSILSILRKADGWAEDENKKRLDGYGLQRTFYRK